MSVYVYFKMKADGYQFFRATHFILILLTDITVYTYIHKYKYHKNYAYHIICYVKISFAVFAAGFDVNISVININLL